MTQKLWVFFKEWVLWILIGVVVYFVITNYVFVGMRVSGPSMQTALLDKQLVGVSKLSTIERGDVIAFDARQEDPRIQSGKQDYVKRVIGVAGDKVAFHDGNLYVNDKKVNQDYLSTEQRESGTALFAQQNASGQSSWTLETLSSDNNNWKSQDRHSSVVPKGCYFVLGDNREVSNDGRYFGFVAKEHVIGKIITPFWNKNHEAVNSQSNHFFAN